ncbi:iron-containing alcohol dehydrogenase [Metallumcola ferriviriculae]|uniref:Iron-containing alcohol dehydrogenase n=1 Tax=Metallumcola ferriviriculae TaxID=3039180 RepID=A0AAU0UQK9_9FIRM|nr:iron-containing alcohol dehydrogenase [Desulfitibacteraceae bacterium MK1]
MDIFKFVTPEIIFGRGALQQIGFSARRLGARKVFLVSDPGVLDAGWVDKTITVLGDAGLEYTMWTGVTPNPKDSEVAEGRQLYEEKGCDAVIALGGGSAIDAAKAVAVLVSNQGDISSYEGVDKISHPLPPIIALPTTAGSGAEVSQFSIIVDVKRKLKMTIISKSLVPDIAIIDPEVLGTKSAELTANTGMDALTHAIESYTSVAATPLTDVQALNAIRLIANFLRKSVASQSDFQAKEAMAMASLQAGLAFSNAILGAVHAMTHQLGGLLDMPHGEANAILLPYVMRYNLIASMEKYAQVAEAFGESSLGVGKRAMAEKAISAVEEMARDIGIPRSLSQVGLTDEFIPKLSENAVKDACLVTNPRDMSRQEIERLFREAL